MKNPKLKTAFLMLVALSLFFAGCAHNVAGDPRYPTDYVVGATYRFKQPVYARNGDVSFLFFASDYMLERLHVNETAEEYEKKAHDTQMYPSYDPRWSNIAGVVQSGAFIRITHIELKKSSFVDTVSIEGQLIDVPWAKHTAYVGGISKRIMYPNFFGVAVDTNILEQVNP